MKWSQWPATYDTAIPVWDPKKGELVERTVSFLLPHELVASLGKTSNLQKLLSKEGFDPKTLEALRQCEESAGGTALLGLGLWGDAVPCNWDRTESLQVFSINCPGLPPPWRGLRLPVTGFSKKHFAGKATHDGIMKVIAWSAEHLALGVWPSSRHDGLPWQPGDVKRRRRAGEALPTRAAMVEFRGDWSHFKECFGLPAWNETAGICWLCKCNPSQLRDFGENAAWRQERLSHWELLERMLRSGTSVSPIFSAPWVRSTMFRPDWLHCADQGVAADFMGNYFLYFIDHKLQGTSRAARCLALWTLIQEYYARENIPDRLQNLVPSMLLKSGSAPPKLRSSAAQCRALVPFAASLAPRVAEDDPLEMAMRVAAVELQGCYAALSTEALGLRAAQLSTCSRRFAAQYVALEAAKRAAGDDSSWRIKPKLHLFLELCSDGSQPSAFWAYRDEDFGGSCAHMARRRGGMLRPSATSRTFLSKFKVLQGPPRIV